MIKKLLIIALLSTGYHPFINADEKLDVDAADSMDFEFFHREKPKVKVEKTYEQVDKNKPQLKQHRPVKSGQMIKPSNRETLTAGHAADDGKRYEIRERYTLERSAATPYSAFYVIEAMHKQMAKYCPNGWIKESEWSMPVEQDFYLHYQFKCL